MYSSTQPTQAQVVRIRQDGLDTVDVAQVTGIVQGEPAVTIREGGVGFSAREGEGAREGG